MKISNAGRGIHQREVPGIDKLRSLPSQWVAFTNLDLALSKGIREIDVILIVDDRILLIDLKDWRGKIVSQDGDWFQNGRYVDRSPVAKIGENTRDVYKLLSAFIQDEDRRTGRKGTVVPRVDCLVVLTGTTNLSGIAATEKNKVITIDDFIKIIQRPKDKIALLGTVRSEFISNPLTSHDWKNLLSKFFNVRTGPFRPGMKRYGGYRATSDDPNFIHTSQVFEEFDVQDEQATQATGILRRWDFSKADTRFQTEDGRAEIAGRERSVIAWLNDRNAEFESILLQPKVDDPDKGVSYWEIFERRRRLERLRDFIRTDSNRLTYDDRLELARQIIVRVKALHDLDAAHLDLGVHSVWMESPSVVRLSHLMVASFPEIRSLGEDRFQFLSSMMVPEQVLGVSNGAKTKDVFLLGCVIHYLIFGVYPNCQKNGDPPEWDSAVDTGSEYIELHPWFEQALSLEPRDRFSHAGAMLEAFNRIFQKHPSNKEIIEGLEKFKTLNSQFQLYKFYPPMIELRDDDRILMWTSNNDGKTQLVKVWKRAAWGDQAKEAPRLLDFLERAAEFIQSPIPGCVHILQAIWLGDSLALIQEYVEAPNLSQFLTPKIAWVDSSKTFKFFQKLCELITELHDRGIAHGDLKPDNILVVVENEDWQPLLVDILDFAPQDDGELRTAAYAPEVGGRFERDRFAVTKIIEEILASSPITVKEAQELSMAISICRAGPPPNSTLLPLLEALREYLTPKSSVTGRAISVSMIGAKAGKVFADEGAFGLRRAPDRPRLYIRGAQEEIEIGLDDAGVPVWGRRQALDQMRIRKRAHYEFISIPMEVEVVSGDQNEFSDIVALLKEPDIAAGWEAAASSMTEVLIEKELGYSEEVVDSSSVEESDEIFLETVEKSQFSLDVDIPLLWRRLIEIENDLTIEGIAIGDSSFRPDRKRHLLPIKLESGTFDFDSDDRVLVERLDQDNRWRKIGNLDLSASSPDLIVIDAWDSIQLKIAGPLVSEDQRVRFHSHFETTSRSRRQEATNRILAGRAITPRLIEVFDPRSSYQALPMAIQLDAATIKTRYDLNDVQAQAMIELLSCRPVGLLQGPPGTGKTRFIGALVHIALTQGYAKNVLLASQSHEAVNNATEAILKLYDAQETMPSILRVGHESAVSDPILPYHVARVEALFKDRFRAELRERLRVAGQSLGLSSDLIECVIDIQTTIHPVVETLQSMITEGDESSSHKIAGIKSTLQHQAKRLGLDLENNIEEADDVIQDLINQVAQKFPTESRDKIARLRSVSNLVKDIMGSVPTRHRSLENFLAGTRQIVAGTCVGLGRSSLGLTSTPFDIVIVDEAARCTASELAVPIQAGRWIVLVGDQEQLEPQHHEGLLTSLSKETKIPVPELKRSDFARVFESSYGQRVGQRLTEQYRMLPPIGDVVSYAFYKGKLTHGRETEEITLSALPEELASPLVWISTDALGSIGLQRSEASGSKSLVNPSEAEAIIAMLKKWDACEPFLAWLEELQIFTKPIGIICTYAAQSTHIRRKLRLAGLSEVLFRSINVDTVDSYQGKENHIVIVSLVRNNTDGDVEKGAATIKQGFMVRPNRINVAMSRAKDRLVIVGAMNRWPAGGPMSRVHTAFSKQLSEGNAMVINASQLILNSSELPMPKSSKPEILENLKDEQL